MSQTAITAAFEQYKAQQEAATATVDLNEFVLALVPNQDADLPIDRNEGLPSQAHIVFAGDVSQVGFVNPNAVVYSLIMDTSIGDFSFNWIGLRNKETGILAAISHIPTAYKLKTVAGTQNGNSVTRSIMMSYVGAKTLTSINVDASTWQIDFTSRLQGVDDANRLSNIDQFGPSAFMADGFNIVKESSGYAALPGVCYVGGLRCEQAIKAPVSDVHKPGIIYIDASLQGNVSSQQQTLFTIKSSASVQGDYVDSHGISHYVAVIAEIDVNGSCIDVRHDNTADPHSQYAKVASLITTAALATRATALGIKNNHKASATALAVSAHLSSSHPHSQYEMANNQASDLDIKEKSKASKHVKLAQLWKAICQEFAAHIDKNNPHSQYEMVNNQASDLDIKEKRNTSKHVKLAQLWKAINQEVAEHTNDIDADPHSQYARLESVIQTAALATRTAALGIKNNSKVSATALTVSAHLSSKNPHPQYKTAADIEKYFALHQKAQDVHSASVISAKTSGMQGKTVQQQLTELKGLVDNLVRQLPPVGIPYPWPNATVPPSHLECNGQSFDRIANPMLAAAYPYGRVPDMRNQTIKGWSNGVGLNPDRDLLSLEQDQNKSHSHTTNILHYGATSPVSFSSATAHGSWRDVESSEEGGDEVRVKNIAFMYIVRAA